MFSFNTKRNGQKKKVQNGITRGDLLLSLLQNDVSAKALPGPNGTICEPF